MTRVRSNTGAVETFRKSTALVQHKTSRQTVAGIAMMFDGLKVAVRVRIVQRSVFAKSFNVVRSLNVMHEWLHCVAASEQVADFIKIDAPGVTATFGK